MEKKAKTPEELARQISFIIKAANACDLDSVKEIESELKQDFSIYEAIGIMDGNPAYYNNSNDKKARYDRIKAIRQLIEIIIHTDKDIIR